VYYPGENSNKRIYVSILLDRAKGRNTVMYSTEGGMDIETVAHNTPHLILKKRRSKSWLRDFNAVKLLSTLV